MTVFSLHPATSAQRPPPTAGPHNRVSAARQGCRPAYAAAPPVRKTGAACGLRNPVSCRAAAGKKKNNRRPLFPLCFFVPLRRRGSERETILLLRSKGNPVRIRNSTAAVCPSRCEIRFAALFATGRPRPGRRGGWDESEDLPDRRNQLCPGRMTRTAVAQEHCRAYRPLFWT